MEEKDSILYDITSEETEPSAGQRFLCNVIDGFIGAALVVGVYVFAPREPMIQLLNVHPLMKFLVAFVLVFGYRLFCLMLPGKTLGMLFFKLKYLNADKQPLSTREKLIAVIATRTSGVKMYKA